VEQCIAAGLVEGAQMSVDGSFVMANASHHSRICENSWGRQRR
jgi:transposase